MSARTPRNFGRRGSAGGFTLIEVMIAVLVLAIGLLGFALLQTMSVRFSKSANQRSQATDLAYDMLDQMRSNRLAAVQYVGDYAANATNACMGLAPATVGAASYRTVWECRLDDGLGPTATANVTYAAGEAVVTIAWGDQRWNVATPNTSFEARSRL